ncbi:tetratricopeptide repeat protein [Gluconobacter morbifer]|uniref:Uncharacterized protein n=1 Tax=Gluconobacter morbifer G707 TaxID=1088869 RepID=G6XJ94_9PROT|nr:hypothetical protein [Gluconobacter morbifer]EHH68210.1 hypothetical protein GMO_15600 [Gluconobacter morbifer G707]
MMRLFPAALMFLCLSGMALAHPVAHQAETGDALPSGWTFVNDPSPILPHPEAAVQEARASHAPPSGMTPPSPAPVPSTSPRATGLWLPLGEMTSVAAFRDRNRLVLVASGRHVLDTAGFAADGTFASLSSRLLDSVTIVTIGMAGGPDPVLRPAGSGWTVSLSPDAKLQPDMLLGQTQGALTFTSPAADDVPQVVALDDPDSGRRLLLGLTRSGVVSKGRTRHGAGFAIRASLMGVVVAADSDAIELRQAGNVLFLDTTGPDSFPLLATGQLQPYGASLSGVGLGTSGQGEGLRRAEKTAALAPAGQRFEARLRVAESAARLANGPLIAEVMDVALQDNPEGVARPDVQRLLQIAAVLNQRPNAALLPEGGGTAPEDQFWRGMTRIVLPSHQPDNEAVMPEPEDRKRTADLIAAGLPVLPGYAQALKQRLLPHAAEWVARYGSSDAVSALKKIPAIPPLTEALLAARDKMPDADAKLARLTHDPSMLVWPVAREEQLRLALTAKSRPPGEIASQLDSLLPALRVAGREAPARLLQLQALMAAQDLSKAQNAIQEWSRLYPQDADHVLPQQRIVAQAMAQTIPQGPDQAMQDVTLLKDALEHATDDGLRRNFLTALANRYKTLGLPEQERETLLSLRTFQIPPERDSTQIRLARLDLAMGDIAAAQTALASFAGIQPPVVTALAGHPPPRNVEVALLKARIDVAQHQDGKAMQELAGLDDPRVLTLQADLAEKASDWGRAVPALQRLLGQQFPGPGPVTTPLSEAQQALILRLGGDAARARAQDVIAWLRTRFDACMTDTPAETMFRLLVGENKKPDGPASGAGQGVGG